MKDFSLEKAFMAVKAQRFEEAQGAYETALSKEATVEAWTGLGVCKIFQLLQDQTMEEVVYCFAKAKEVPGADIKEIDTKLISYSSLVIEQGVAYYLSLMEQIKQAQKDATKAIVTSAISAYVASNSKSLGGTIVSSGVAAAAGVAVGKLGDINGAETAGQLTANMLDQVVTHLINHLVETENTEELNKFLNRSQELQKIIEDSYTPQIGNSEEWYNTYWVWVWVILFWPVGVYGLLKKYNVIK